MTAAAQEGPGQCSNRAPYTDTPRPNPPAKSSDPGRQCKTRSHCQLAPQTSIGLLWLQPVSVPQAWPHTTRLRVQKGAIFRREDILWVFWQAIPHWMGSSHGGYPDDREQKVELSQLKTTWQHAEAASNPTATRQRAGSPGSVCTSNPPQRERPLSRIDQEKSDYFEHNTRKPKESA